jgi:hypothetical protein
LEPVEQESVEQESVIAQWVRSLEELFRLLLGLQLVLLALVVILAMYQQGLVIWSALVLMVFESVKLVGNFIQVVKKLVPHTVALVEAEGTFVASWVR